MPVVSLSSARFQLLRSEEVEGLHISVEEIVQAAFDYELRESKGIRSWSPVIHQVIQHLFDITHGVGDSYIVADPVFEHWTDKLNLESTDFGNARVMFNLRGHYELPFDTKSSEALAQWVASLPNSLS